MLVPCQSIHRNLSRLATILVATKKIGQLFGRSRRIFLQGCGSVICRPERRHKSPLGHVAGIIDDSRSLNGRKPRDRSRSRPPGSSAASKSCGASGAAPPGSIAASESCSASGTAAPRSGTSSGAVGASAAIIPRSRATPAPGGRAGAAAPHCRAAVGIVVVAVVASRSRSDISSAIVAAPWGSTIGHPISRPGYRNSTVATANL